MQESFQGYTLLSEIGYAIELGYILLEVQEAIVFKKLEYVFSDFMRFLASCKIRYSKIPPSYKHDLQKYCDFVNEKMDFTHKDDILTPELLVENTSTCKMYKDLSNLLWLHRQLKRLDRLSN